MTKTQRTKTEADVAKNDKASDSPLFVPIGDYETPGLPTEHSLRRMWNRLKDAVTERDESPFVTADRLSAANTDLLDDVTSPKECGPLIEAFEAELGPWLSQQKHSGIKLVVMPPCDPHDSLQSWARQQRHFIVQAPTRVGVFDGAMNFPPDCDRDAVLVIPRLEHWFLRHQRGLQAIRMLFSKIQALEQPCVIGCNSWAWAYLCAATGAHSILPPAIVPAAFDAQRLHSWFSELASSAKPSVSFRLARSGVDVLASDADGMPQDSYLTELASNSKGIPWVARLMWAESLRSHSDLEQLEQRARTAVTDDKKTLWVEALPEPQLTLEATDSVWLVLQSLLIHGGLNATDLQLTLPSNCDLDVIPALITSHFVERCDGLIQVRPSSYPRVRHLLATAGLPTDRL